MKYSSGEIINMPKRPVVVVAYAAAASLAAMTFVYVFSPSLFSNDSSMKSKRRTAIGLSNPANDCFINSVLQAMAGLDKLRLCLQQEVLQRYEKDPEKYHCGPSQREEAESNEALIRSETIHAGLVTEALKDILDQLCETPLRRRTISAQPFVATLEYAFATRVNRRQQDAHELLHILAERLCDEYHANVKACKQPGNNDFYPIADETENECSITAPIPERNSSHVLTDEREVEDSFQYVDPLKDVEQMQVSDDVLDDNGFPFEGKLESHIECLKCHFKPKPSVSSFVTLTLPVPQQHSTTLDQCLDGLLKQEIINDYKCDRCRLEHALHELSERLSKLTDSSERKRFQSDIHKLDYAIQKDAEVPPSDVDIADVHLAATQRIGKHVRISVFPAVLAVHLSRSIYDPGTYSMKNSAKVKFPEVLSLGGVLDQRNYKLLAVITHLGGHNSGHYETFRRQSPKSTNLPVSAAKTEGTSFTESGQSQTDSHRLLFEESSKIESMRSLQDVSGSLNTVNQEKVMNNDAQQVSTSLANVQAGAVSSLTASSSEQSQQKSSLSEIKRLARKNIKHNDRWWRISDDKVKESTTSDVLALQKEAYLLFYDMIHP